MRPSFWTRALLGLGLVPVQQLIDTRMELYRTRSLLSDRIGLIPVPEPDPRLYRPTWVACPECGAEIDTRTAEVL